MSHKKSPGLWIETGVDEKISVVMVDGFGQEQRLPPVTPAEDLIHAAEIDYSAYRREIRNLWEKHPLFKKRLHIPVSGLEDLTEEAVTLPSMLQETDPLSFLALGSILDRALRIEDDGSALFLLYAGERLLRALEIPFRTQIRLRNIMEITFDGTERNTQQERYQKLRSAYPKIAQFCDPAKLDGYENTPLLLPVDSVYQLRLTELLLYFRQQKQRIARCDYCWGYFIPKTRTAARYCDRSFEGQTCKRRGANLKRKKGPEQDGALKLFKQLRDRMYARMLRYEEAPESQRKNLIPMTVFQYGEWEENARQARREYIAGTITAEEFLRRIDTTHELDSYDTVKQEPSTEKSKWQKRVTANPDFDPELKYPSSMMILDLRTDTDTPQGQYLSREELIRKDQEGHQSLRDQYGGGTAASSSKQEDGNSEDS